jgi:hypothetical protein
MWEQKKIVVVGISRGLFCVDNVCRIHDCEGYDERPKESWQLMKCNQHHSFYNHQPQQQQLFIHRDVQATINFRKRLLYYLDLQPSTNANSIWEIGARGADQPIWRKFISL